MKSNLLLKNIILKLSYAAENYPKLFIINLQLSNYIEELIKIKLTGKDLKLWILIGFKILRSLRIILNCPFSIFNCQLYK